MVEPLAALGIVVLNSVFQEILLKLVKEGLEDYVKDFFKGCIKEGVASGKPDILKKALREALVQFLRIVQDELELNCGLSGVNEYKEPIGRFLRDQEVKPLLGKAFEKDCRAIDAKQLKAIWVQRYAPAMPTEFDWDGVAKEYVKEVKRIIKNSPELKANLELEIQSAIENNTRELVGISPNFDLEKYQKGLLDCYGNLKLDSIDKDGSAYHQLKLWRIFIPQNVRQVHERLPQIYEIPKEPVAGRMSQESLNYCAIAPSMTPLSARKTGKTILGKSHLRRLSSSVLSIPRLWSCCATGQRMTLIRKCAILPERSWESKNGLNVIGCVTTIVEMFRWNVSTCLFYCGKNSSSITSANLYEHCRGKVSSGRPVSAFACLTASV